MPNDSRIRTTENFRLLQDLERLNGEFTQEIEAAESCGIECEIHRSLNRAWEESLARIRKKFFDPPPTE